MFLTYGVARHYYYLVRRHIDYIMKRKIKQTNGTYDPNSCYTQNASNDAAQDKENFQTLALVRHRTSESFSRAVARSGKIP